MSRNLSEINDLSEDEFLEIFGNAVEHCTDAAKFAFNKKPFATIEELMQGFHDFLDDLDEEGKINVLKLHPELACKKQHFEKLTMDSKNEQKSAGMTKIMSFDQIQMDLLNEQYKQKFKFPFVICTKEHKNVPSVVTAFKLRIENPKPREIENGILEVKKIAKFRILQIIRE